MATALPVPDRTGLGMHSKLHCSLHSVLDKAVLMQWPASFRRASESHMSHGAAAPTALQMHLPALQCRDQQHGTVFLHLTAHMI